MDVRALARNANHHTFISSAPSGLVSFLNDPGVARKRAYHWLLQVKPSA
jgi:hypothetical protein